MSFPRKRESRLAGHCALCRCDSRLRGNDAGECVVGSVLKQRTLCRSGKTLLPPAEECRAKRRMRACARSPSLRPPQTLGGRSAKRRRPAATSSSSARASRDPRPKGRAMAPSLTGSCGRKRGSPRGRRLPAAVSPSLLRSLRAPVDATAGRGRREAPRSAGGDMAETTLGHDDPGALSRKPRSPRPGASRSPRRWRRSFDGRRKGVSPARWPEIAAPPDERDRGPTGGGVERGVGDTRRPKAGVRSPARLQAGSGRRCGVRGCCDAWVV